ncbi:MAG: hypothetical protein GF365_02820 [Candidatus Buchananbacteria bacterium]|nr:hypothetical protein [Candidatus Buchananbacteria bacterium]
MSTIIQVCYLVYTLEDDKNKKMLQKSNKKQYCFKINLQTTLVVVRTMTKIIYKI